jgi:hypothetical protein
MMLTTSRFPAGWLVSLLALPLQADLCPAQTQLRWHLAEGTRLDVRMSQSTKTVTTLRDRTSEVSIETALEMSWQVDRVAADGTLSMTQAFTRFAFRSTAPDGKATLYDSASQPPPDEAQAIARVMQPALGLKFAVSLSRRGEILEVRPPAEAESLLADTPGQEAWTRLLSKDGLTRTLRQALGLLPEAAVNVGDTWAVSRELSLPQGELVLSDTFTYDGTVRSGRRVLERIGVVTQARRKDVEAGPEKPEWVDRQDLRGVYFFDAQAGHLVESRLSQTLASEAPSGDDTVQVKTIGSLVLRIAPARN